MSTPTATAAPLDDVMLAMDVVDTLRHRQDLVARELDEATREKQLIDKLRELYHQQGIEVPDHILKEGVEALAESRFVYTPPKGGFGTTLARLYVGRRRWGPAVLTLALVLFVALFGYFGVYRPMQAAGVEAARVELAETLPAQMDALYQTIFDETKVQQAVEDAEEIRQRGKTAASEGNRVGAMAAVTALSALRDRVQQEFYVVVVNRPDVKSGFWTFPEINTAATNYYLVVEALTSDGTKLKLPILNEENGQTETVDIWGQRVSEALYQQVSNDKLDDGIIEDNRLGFKEYGYLDPKFRPQVMPGAVTRW